MSVAAAVPVKALGQAKSRLAREIPDPSGLVLFMLDRVLDTLQGSPAIGRLAVVSPDARVLERARARGCEPLAQARGGLNEACAQACAWTRPGEALLVVHADLPWLTGDDLESVLALAGDDDPIAVLGADRWGTGTNLLLARPPTALRFHFGPDSLGAHLEEARLRNVPARVVRRPGIAHDLDTANDLEAIATLPVLPGLERLVPPGCRAPTSRSAEPEGRTPIPRSVAP